MLYKLILFAIGLFCFCTAIVFMIRANSLTDNYNAYYGSSKKQIRSSKLLALTFLIIGIVLQLIIFRK